MEYLLGVKCYPCALSKADVANGKKTKWLNATLVRFTVGGTSVVPSLPGVENLETSLTDTKGYYGFQTQPLKARPTLYGWLDAAQAVQFK